MKLPYVPRYVWFNLFKGVVLMLVVMSLVFLAIVFSEALLVLALAPGNRP